MAIGGKFAEKTRELPAMAVVRRLAAVVALAVLCLLAEHRRSAAQLLPAPPSSLHGSGGMGPAVAGTPGVPPPGLGLLPPPPASLTLCLGNWAMQDYVFNWLYHAHRVPALLPRMFVTRVGVGE